MVRIRTVVEASYTESLVGEDERWNHPMAVVADAGMEEEGGC